jgi:hypothetical protein
MSTGITIEQVVLVEVKAHGVPGHALELCKAVSCAQSYGESRLVVPPAGLEPTHPAPEAGALSN